MGVDKDGHPIYQRVPKVVEKGSLTPPSELPSTIVGQGAIPKIADPAMKLSQNAKTVLSNIYAAQNLFTNGLNQLQGMDKLPDRAEFWASYALYNLGFPTKEPQMAGLFECIALANVIGTSAYLRGMRNFQWVEMIQKHLPHLTDDPRLVIEKINSLNKNLPIIANAVLQSESLTVPRRSVTSPGGVPIGGSQPLPPPSQLPPVNNHNKGEYTSDKAP
jgi:hypothetical protein